MDASVRQERRCLKESCQHAFYTRIVYEDNVKVMVSAVADKHPA
jgi:hypothetical protein